MAHLVQVGLEGLFDSIKTTQGFAKYLNSWWDKSGTEFMLLKGRLGQTPVPLSKSPLGFSSFTCHAG